MERLEGERGAFVLHTDRGDEVRARAVLLAAGAGAFGPNRPPLDGLDAFEATGAVQYLVRRRDEFAGKRVVIAGGGDSAVDWALSLKDVAAKVYRRASPPQVPRRARDRRRNWTRPPRGARSRWSSPISCTACTGRAAC